MYLHTCTCELCRVGQLAEHVWSREVRKCYVCNCYIATLLNVQLLHCYIAKCTTTRFLLKVLFNREARKWVVRFPNQTKPTRLGNGVKGKRLKSPPPFASLPPRIQNIAIIAKLPYFQVFQVFQDCEIWLRL